MAEQNSINKESEHIDFKPVSSLADVEGRVGYSDPDKALSLKTDIAGSTQSLGQEFWIRVINKTGVSIPDGSLVTISGFDAPSGRPTIVLGKADVEATSNVVGFTTNTMANNAEGFVTAMGFLNDLDTSSFSEGDEVFLSDTVAGAVTATKPLNAIPVGFITKVNATTGQILTIIARKIVDSPLFAHIVDKTNQKPAVTTPVAVTFNTNKKLRGITHNTVSASEDIIIDISGTYTFFAQPQAEKTSGGGTEAFHMWARIGTDDKGGISSVSVANPSVITTDAPHGLTSGQTVEITDVVTTPDINAQHVITVTGASTFTIPVNVTVVTDGVGNWRRILDINDDDDDGNVELNLTGATDSDVIPLIITADFVAGQKINIMQSVSATGLGVGLVAKTPAGEPAIPSIIFVINRN